MVIAVNDKKIIKIMQNIVNRAKVINIILRIPDVGGTERARALGKLLNEK